MITDAMPLAIVLRRIESASGVLESTKHELRQITVDVENNIDGLSKASQIALKCCKDSLVEDIEGLERQIRGLNKVKNLITSGEVVSATYAQNIIYDLNN